MTGRHRKTRQKKYRLTHRIAAAITVGAMCGPDGTSFAQNTTTTTTTAPTAVDLSNHIATSSHGFTSFLNFLCYICGSGLGVYGIYKLKDHVDRPDQIPMRQGVIRLAAGGSLLSLPFIISAMQGSVSRGNANAVPLSTKMPSFSGGAVSRIDCFPGYNC